MQNVKYKIGSSILHFTFCILHFLLSVLQVLRGSVELRVLIVGEVFLGANDYEIWGETSVGEGGREGASLGGGGGGGRQNRDGGNGGEGGECDRSAWADCGCGAWVDVALLGGEPVGEGDAGARAIVKGVNVLLRAFAERLLPY